MPLDPQAQTLLDQLAAIGGPKLEELPPPEARLAFNAFATMVPQAAAARTSDHRVPVSGGEIDVRLHWPLGAEDAAEPLPVLVYLHGGGFTVGNLETSDSTATELANASGCAVVNVDYRLAPEHPFPTPLEDCYAALSWVVDHAGALGVDGARIAVGGDSAGGNLSAAVCLLAKQRGGPAVRFQLLIYPCVDARMSYPSIKQNGEGYLLTETGMRWFWDNYLAGGADPEDPLLSPVYASVDDLAGLPPALVITAEYDPLRDEAEAYAERLRQAGVPVETSRYDGMVHGFVPMSQMWDAAQKAVDEAARALRAAL
jgi:acetyl esterase